MLFYRKIKEKDLDPSIKFIQCPKSYTSKNFSIIDSIVTCPVCGKKPKIYRKMDRIGGYWSNYKIQCKKPFKRAHASATCIDELDIDNAEIIQDYLDELNQDFIDKSEAMARKGKINIKI